MEKRIWFSSNYEILLSKCHYEDMEYDLKLNNINIY